MTVATLVGHAYGQSPTNAFGGSGFGITIPGPRLDGDLIIATGAWQKTAISAAIGGQRYRFWTSGDTYTTAYFNYGVGPSNAHVLVFRPTVPDFAFRFVHAPDNESSFVLQPPNTVPSPQTAEYLDVEGNFLAVRIWNSIWNTPGAPNSDLGTITGDDDVYPLQTYHGHNTVDNTYLNQAAAISYNDGHTVHVVGHTNFQWQGWLNTNAWNPSGPTSAWVFGPPAAPVEVLKYGWGIVT
jgi:hypothetical protein